MATLGTIEARVEITGHKYLAYLKAHETLLIVVFSILFLVFGTSKILNYLEKRDQRIYDKNLAALQSDKDHNAVTAQVNADLAKQYADLAKSVLSENTKLEAAIAARDVATKKQQNLDLALLAPDLAIRWETLVPLQPASITATPDGNFAATDQAARETVQALEVIPGLKADLADVKTKLENREQQLSKQDEVVTGLHTQIDGLNTQIASTEKSWHSEVDLVKAQARKSKLRYFAAGYVAGLLTRPLIKAFAQ